MLRALSFALIWSLPLASLSAAQDSSPFIWPTAQWRESSPEAQGISSADLADALEFARTRQINVHSLTVIRNGVIILDAYFYPFGPDQRHDVASVTKSVVSMLTGIAIEKGHIAEGLDQSVSVLSPLLPREVSGPAAQIRVRDLLAMRSGLDCGFRTGEPELRAMRGSADWIAYALGLPVLAEHGTRYGYCSPNSHLLSGIVTSVTGSSALDYARVHLFEPLGISDVYWPADPKGINHGWGDLQLRPRDMAKLGLLMLERGRWAETQILSSQWIDRSTAVLSRVNESEDYGLGWWVSRTVPSLFEANGRGGQRISVIPDKRIIVVMTGGGFEPGDLGTFLLRAVRADQALEENPEARARLAQELRAIAQPPSPTSTSFSSAASRVSNRVYRLEENPLGVRAFSVDFSQDTAATLRLVLSDGQELVQSLGLNGVYKRSLDPSGAWSAGRGRWLTDGRFRIEYDRLTLINRYQFDVEFAGNEVRIDAFEPTELGRALLVGKSP